MVWAEDGSSKTRMQTIQAILERKKLTATELRGRMRRQALQDFHSGGSWLRADAVDRLSEEEAGVIAARFVRRVQAKTPIPQTKAEMLRRALADTIKERFLRPPEKPSPTHEEERAAFFEAAARYLNESELTPLREAVALGYRPLPGEK